jgi:hypothetical protein
MEANMQELTMSEALKDPLIRLLLRADRISLGQFAELLERAASRRHQQLATTPTPARRGGRKAKS